MIDLDVPMDDKYLSEASLVLAKSYTSGESGFGILGIKNEVGIMIARQLYIMDSLYGEMPSIELGKTNSFVRSNGERIALVTLWIGTRKWNRASNENVFPLLMRFTFGDNVQPELNSIKTYYEIFMHPLYKVSLDGVVANPNESLLIMADDYLNDPEAFLRPVWSTYTYLRLVE